MSIGSIGRYFDERAATWDSQTEESGVKHLMIARLADVREGSHVLDVGCGTGVMERAYLELEAERIVALDVSQEMINIARENYAVAPPSRLEFRCMDIIDFESDELFDCVVIYNAFPHILDKDELAATVARRLVPGGRFLVAHGMSRAALNAHHSEVPAHVTSELLSAQEEARPFERYFDIDMMADTPFTYFFGGTLRA